ncbi:MAG: methyltransferase domain-containing protein [Betaproteobacteria bacterium]|nr:methyltransferase domain-containing protein [Betaproteobacteria bacterium]
MTTADDYDAWYRTPRGAWIGGVEFATLTRALGANPGERVLDVGCGTGYFTRRLATECALDVVGLDPDRAWLDFARAHAAGGERYCAGRAEALPFPDASFDRTVSVTALCFVADPRRAVEEMLRVTRTRVVLGLLHRRSLLHLQKGRGGGVGAYRGAHWHTRGEVRELFAGLPISGLTSSTAVLLGGGGHASRVAERAASWLPLGAFFVAAADVRAVR